MFDILIDNINQLYEIIIHPYDDNIKCGKIHNFKNEHKICGTIGEYYYGLTGIKKEKGLVYTPNDIVQYMIKNSLNPEEIIKNPYIKILDPSCGTGNFLIPVYKYLFNIFMENYDEIKFKISTNDIRKHILENNIFGYDVDPVALKILSIDLYNISGYFPKNIHLNDFLINEDKDIYDLIIGNPPYIGHKTMDKEYSIKLKKIFSDVYNDKSDISACFFSKSLDIIYDNSNISFITSRYFMESPSGAGLRKVLCRNSIKQIVDFYGLRPFKNVGIDPIIIFLSKGASQNKLCNIIKPEKNIDVNNFIDKINSKQKYLVKNFYINNNNFKEKTWCLIPNEDRKIIKKIEEKCDNYLGEICTSYQGIITGCDKAFVINEIENADKIEKTLIKKWIKSSNIKKGCVTGETKYLIYSNDILDESLYPEALEYIKKHKEKLLERRECKRGVIKWYQLQWGRNKEIFEGEKIIFPYKASENRFSYDKGSFFSADVYSLLLNNNMFSMNYNYLMLQDILNSKLYEYYFQSFGKKLGNNLYEYYPNTVNRIKIPVINGTINDESIFEYFKLTNAEKEIVFNKFDNMNTN